MTDQGSTNATAAELREQIAQRGKELAASVTQATEVLSEKAVEAWHDSEPARKEALRAAQRAGTEAAVLGQKAWRERIRPSLRDLWSRRTAALAAAGMAIPAGRELAEDAAVRLGLRKREEGHWGAFFFGLIVGGIAGVVAALLTAPKPGGPMREQLVATARETASKARQTAAETAEKARQTATEVAGKARQTATEAAGKARETAAKVGEKAMQASAEWVPIFQRADAPVEPVEPVAEDEAKA